MRTQEQLAVDRDAATLAAAADDFGHLVHRPPSAVVRPGSAEDVAAAVRWAAREGRRVAAQGQRHTVFGRAQVGDGVAVDMRGLRTVHEVRDGAVVVDAGVTWREVLAATLTHGLTPPALPDYLDLSVGGTLVVGGVGGTGVVSDTVLALDVVTGRAETRTCSPTRDADLFDAVRAGLGQVGILTRATLPLVPAPRRVRRFLLHYPDLRTMLDDQRRLVAEHRFDAVQGAVLAAPTGGWTFRVDVATFCTDDPPADDTLLAGLSDDRARVEASTLPYLAYRDRLALLERALRATGQWAFPHPWLTTFVGDAAVEAVVERELGLLRPADLGAFGQVALSPVGRPATPLLRLPADGLCFAVNLLRFPDGDDVATAERLVVANRAVYDRVRADGGVLYPVSAFPMSPDDWRQHFGEAFRPLAAAKRAHDPDRLLTPGYEVFA